MSIPGACNARKCRGGDKRLPGKRIAAFVYLWFAHCEYKIGTDQNEQRIRPDQGSAYRRPLLYSLPRRCLSSSNSEATHGRPWIRKIPNVVAANNLHLLRLSWSLRLERLLERRALTLVDAGCIWHLTSQLLTGLASNYQQVHR